MDGVGPELSFVTESKKVGVALELKWLPDSHLDHRTEGDSVWFKLAVGF